MGKAVQFAAMMLTALALVPAGAHLFELPNKIGLAREAYFTVQSIYRGWALFGVALIGAILLNAVHAVLVRGEPAAFRPALLATVLLFATLAIFLVWTYPANQATANWTTAPANWLDLRRQWEYAHAAGAVLTFAALACLTLSLLAARR